ESAVRILNMVPTKKVDKTPYEIWHGKAPNLSYLKVWGCEAYVKRDSADKLQQRSVKTTRAPNRLCLNMKVEDDEVGDLGEPANYKTVMLDPDKVIWQGAMDEEMKSMKVNKVWIVVDRPPNAKVVRNKWLYKMKTDMDGKMKNYVAQLEHLGYVLPRDLSVVLILSGLTIDFVGFIKETNILVKSLKIIQKLVELSSSLHLQTRRSERRNRTLLDMVRSMINLTTFPLSFWDYALETATRILKMVSTKKVDKTPYEIWYAEFLEKNIISQEVSRRAVELEEIQYEDTSPFEITSEIPIEVEGFEPPQEELILVHRFKMDNSKSGNIPMQERLDLNKTQCASILGEVKNMQNVHYASAVGSIMYAVRCTRPDVANPKAKLRFDCYCNAGFETDRDEIKSLTGYVFVLNESAVD
nr:retrotransposon protein, putative, Ty1-copia subclass [Tanacetum cinerariifolium]